MGGRVNKNDMLKYVEARKSGVPGAKAVADTTIISRARSGAPSFAPQVPQPMAAPAFAASGEPVTIIPMDNIRQKIAEHMVRSVHTSAHVTSDQRSGRDEHCQLSEEE